MISKSLSSADRQAIEAELEEQRLDHQWPVAPSLDQLVETWRRFVGEVEAGYRLSVYDYTEDLATRDILDRLFEIISREPGSNPLRAERSPLGDRFRLAT